MEWTMWRLRWSNHCPQFECPANRVRTAACSNHYNSVGNSAKFPNLTILQIWMYSRTERFAS